MPSTAPQLVFAGTVAFLGLAMAIVMIRRLASTERKVPNRAVNTRTGGLMLGGRSALAFGRLLLHIAVTIFYLILGMAAAAWGILAVVEWIET